MKCLTALFATASALALGACAQANQPVAAPGPSTATSPEQAGPHANGPAMMGHGHAKMGHVAKGAGMGKGMMGPGKGEHCPMGLEGTTARVEEVKGGAALVFATSGDVAELRRRVTAMAEMHNQQRGKGCPMMGMHAAGAPPESPSTPTEHDAHHPKSDAKSPPTP